MIIKSEFWSWLCLCECWSCRYQYLWYQMGLIVSQIIAPLLLAQLLVQTRYKGHTKTPHTGHLWRESTIIGRSLQRASNEESVSISWCHHITHWSSLIIKRKNWTLVASHIFLFIFYFKYIYTGYNQSVTNCSTLEPCPKKIKIFTICIQNNSFHINMIYTAIW